MSQQVVIITALCLPAPEIEALIQGRTIAAVPRLFLRPGQQFALYPADTQNETIIIKAWARCELCQVLDATESLENLSPITVWTTESLQEMLGQRANIFLAYLRVYLLAQPLKMSLDSTIGEKIGKFVGLPNSLTVTHNLPVLSESIFVERKRHLEERKQINGEITITPDVKQTVPDIETILNSLKNLPIEQTDPDLEWIKTIAKIGNSSDGNSFEKLVRKALLKLGFSCSNTNPRGNLDPEKVGGSSGLDFYCEFPYSVVGECKASKNENVPKRVCTELIDLGILNLGSEQYNRSIKLIIAAGPLVELAKKAAIENKMNVIRPETLQRLVELKANYQGSINLLDLKQCLQSEPFGIVDNKVNDYIDRVKQVIKLRSHIVETVKQLGEVGSEHPTIAIRAHYNVMFAKEPSPKLDDLPVHELLIELSSPLAGYLGRKKGNDWQSDRFYYLRDLIVEEEKK